MSQKSDPAAGSSLTRKQGLSSSAYFGLILAGLYCLGFGLYQSKRRLMGLDEFFAWNIINDPSWRHALYAWNHGVDGGGFLFYASLWPLVRGSGSSVLLTRLVSTAAYFIAAVTWWRALTRFIESRWAAAGIVLVWVSSAFLLGYVYMIRFYSLYLCLSALAVYTLIRTAEESWSRSTSVIFIFLVNAALVLTHMIGIVYSGLVLGAWLLCVTWRRRLWLFALPIVAGWSLLLFCRTAIYYSSLNYGYPAMPRPWDILRFYFKSAAALPILLLAAIGLFVALRQIVHQFKRDRDTSKVAFVAPVLCLVYLLSPIGLYVICLLSKPIAAGRYLLPYSLSLGTLCAYALQEIAAMLKAKPLWLQRTAGLAFATALLLLHLQALRNLPPPPSIDTTLLNRIGRNTAVAVEDETAFFTLQHYFSAPGQQYFFIAAPTGTKPGLMGVVASQGYYPGHILRADSFYGRFPDFALLADEKHRAIPWNPLPRHCAMKTLAQVRVFEVDEPLYAVRNCKQGK